MDQKSHNGSGLQRLWMSMNLASRQGDSHPPTAIGPGVCSSQWQTGAPANGLLYSSPETFAVEQALVSVPACEIVALPGKENGTEHGVGESKKAVI